MNLQTVHLDLREATADQQVRRLKEQYVSLRGGGSIVRARVEERPVRQYISMLERGYRVLLEHDNGATYLVLQPDGSTPRVELGGAHSVAFHPDGRIYSNTRGNRVVVCDGSTRRVRKHILVGN